MDNTRSYDIAWLPGDGIGPEVTREALRVLETVGSAHGFSVTATEHRIGGAALDETGGPLPGSTREACLESDAVLLGAVGGPQWNDNTGEQRPERGLLALRKRSASTPICARSACRRPWPAPRPSAPTAWAVRTFCSSAN
jgi:Isocitrate/isopropylmalate dehydrogenase